MQADDAVRVRHMIDAVEDAMEFVRARNRADLGKDKMLQFALVRAIEVLGEAAGKVSAAGRQSRACATDSFMPTLMSILISCGSPPRRRFRSCALN
jgi:hypothetical protein